eukprot:2020531-Prymnesium_polylepis.2
MATGRARAVQWRMRCSPVMHAHACHAHAPLPVGRSCGLVLCPDLCARDLPALGHEAADLGALSLLGCVGVLVLAFALLPALALRAAPLGRLDAAAALLLVL